MQIELSSKLRNIYESINVVGMSLNITTEIRSISSFRIYCNDIDKKFFFYSVIENNERLLIKGVFPKNIINIAPKINKLMRSLANDFQYDFIEQDKHFLVVSNQEYQFDCINDFIKKTRIMFKDIVRIVGYYYVPKNFIDVRKNSPFNIRLKGIKDNSIINYGSLVIGRNTIINGNIQSKNGKVFLGQFIAGGHNIEFIAGNHLMQLPNLQITLQKKIDGGTRKSYMDRGFIDIGNNVWIGDNAVFLNNVIVGDGAIIGTGSIVTHDVPPFAIVAGVPARIIKYRYTPSVIQQMLDIQWWNWDMKRILSEKKFFSTEIMRDVDFDVYSLLNNPLDK